MVDVEGTPPSKETVGGVQAFNSPAPSPPSYEGTEAWKGLAWAV